MTSTYTIRNIHADTRYAKAVLAELWDADGVLRVVAPLDYIIGLAAQEAYILRFANEASVCEGSPVRWLSDMYHKKSS